MKRMTGFVVSLLLLTGFVWTTDVRADTCEARVSTDVPDFQAGKPSPIICDTHGQPRTLLVRPDGSPVYGNVGSTQPALPSGTANAAAPVYSEGTIVGWSFDLAGNARVTLGTLLSGEDTTNNLIRTSGGAVRSTSIMTDVTTNTASATVALFTGPKTFSANIDGTGALTGTVTIYLDSTSTAETLNPICVLILDATTRGEKYCNLPTPTIFPFAHAVTSLVTGTGAAVDVKVHY